MGQLFRLLVIAILGVLLGGLSALWMGGMIRGGPQIGNAVSVDGWRSDWSIGSENANPYVRAVVARNGLLALRKEEAVYFIQTKDDAGDQLEERCTYRVSGSQLPAGWWSITLYDGQSKLPMNDDERLSFDQTKADYIFADVSDIWMFEVSADSPDDLLMPWVSSRAAGKFDLMLRLYQPNDALLADPETVLTPPSIFKLSCEGDA
ncbi:MAG: DUF1214 domain-containing protein [Pseudomonadota bacterium]